MESVVISLGGSVILSDEADVRFFKDLVDLLKKLSQNCKIFIIVGGGKTARTYIKTGRTIGFDEKTLDQIGIDITRINAKFLASIVRISNKIIPVTTDEAKEMKEDIVIMGGTTPGHSTDMVGAELAEKTKASKYIIATNVDGVYDKDPNKHPDAKKFDEISVKQLINDYGTSWESAGKNTVIDGPALEIIDRAEIQTIVLNGKKLDELEKAITNQKFNGTIIKN